MKDQRGVEILEGDRLHCCDGYDVVACREDGTLVGRLVCLPNHPCANIPFSLNDGVRHTVTLRGPQPIVILASP